MDNVQETESMVLSLSQEELALVVRALNGTTLPGLGDPPFGEVKPEVTQLLLAAGSRALVARQLLQVLPDGTMQMERTLASIISVCLRPDQMLAMMATINDSATEQRYHYRVQDINVVHTLPQLGIHTFTFSTRFDFGQAHVLERLSQLSPGESGNAYTMAQATLADAQATAKVNPVQAEKDLVAAGWTEPEAKSFAQALAAPQLRLGLQFLYQRTPTLRQLFFTLLAHPTGLWLAETTDFNAPTITFKRVTLAEVRQRVEAAYAAYA